MKKPIINVIERKKEFYVDDIKSIEKKEDDWGELEVLEDLTETSICEEIEEDEEIDTSAEGVVICWNKRLNKIEILNYKY